MNWIIKFFSSSEMLNGSLGPYDLRKRKLFISFVVIGVSSLLFFTISHILTGKYIIAGINFVAISLFIAALFNYKATSNYVNSAKGFCFSALLLISVQHFLAPLDMQTNLMWLPVIVFISYFILPVKIALRMTVGAIVLGVTAHVGNFFFTFDSVQFTRQDVHVTNILLIILTNYVAFATGQNIAREQKNMLRDLNESNDILKEVKESNGALLSVLTHDMANVITVGYNYSKMMNKESFESKKVKKAFEKMHSSFQMMNDITGEVRSIQALQDGKNKLTLVKVDLVDAIKKSIELNEHRCEVKSVKVEFDHKDKDLFIYGDEISLIHSILSNLISNAIKFSNSHGIVSITCEQDEVSTKVSVKDFGVGIPEEIVPILFDPSAKTSRNGTAGEVGTGFGMPLVKSFVDRYDGTISIDTSIEPENSGTEFVIQFKTFDKNESKKVA